MTSLSCGVDALLRAAQYLQYLEDQESGQPVQQQPPLYRPIVLENPPISTDDDKPIISSISSPSPSLVVISRPTGNFNSQSVSIDLSKNNNAGSAIPLSTLSNGTNSITIYHNIDESQASLNLSTESSGYVSNSTTSSLGNVSLNQSGTNGDDLEIDGKANTISSANSNNSTATLIVDQRMPSLQQSQTTFNPLPMPQSSSSIGRRRTISSNSNSSALRSPSTVRAGTREVHNKLEKNRRAHLKECFESLKRQLPVTADEKKTSNLSILGAAIRHIQFLKRKEREYEHEMERLAKEKIAAQNRILFLKRELAQWDVDFSKILPEQSGESVKSERGNDLSHESPIKIFNPSATLSSLTPTLSNNTSNLTTNGNSLAISPPPRITPQIQIPATMTPLSLTTKEDSSLTINPVKISSKSTLMPVTTSMAMANQISNSIPATLSLKQNDSVSSQSPLPATVANQNMALNLHATAPFSTIQQQQQQPLNQNGLKNGYKNYHHNKEMKSGKSLSPIITANLPASITPATATTPISTSNSTSMKSSSIEQNDPPTKLIKLINGNAILASMDKDNKMIHSGLTLQQVVGGGGLVVSSLLTTPQGFKVINQPNGLTTIELSPQINGQAPSSSAIQRPTQITTAAANNISQPGNLQKLLLNGNGTVSSTAANINTNNIPSLTQQTNGSNNHRLTPGGAELNILPSSNNHSTTSTTNNNGAIYRSQGKLIVKESNNSSSRVHVVQSTPVVSVVSQQPQNSTMTHIITSSSPHLTGKMLQQPTAQQYLSTTTATVKPMIVVNNNGNGSPTSNINEIGKI